MNPFSVVLAAVSSGSGSAGINSAGIFGAIWALINGFLSNLVTDFGTLFNEILVQSLGSSFVTIFSNWGYSVSSEGIWAPFVAVLVLALTGYAVYAFIDLYGLERDVLGAERDL